MQMLSNISFLGPAYKMLTHDSFSLFLKTCEHPLKQQNPIETVWIWTLAHIIMSLAMKQVPFYWLCCGGEQQTRGRPLPLVLLSNGGLARRALTLPHTHAQNMHTQSAHSKTKCTHCTDIHTNVCMHPDSQRLEHFLLSLGTVLSQTVREMLTLPHQTAWLWELQAMPIFNHLMPV